MTISINGTNGLIQAYDYQVLTTGFSYTFAAGTQVLVINPAGTLATGTITMPAAPSDGMTITVESTQQVTALTMSGNGGTVVGAAVQLIPNQPLSWVYRATGTTWYPFRGGAGRASGLVSGTSQASTSGTSIDFTGIPSWVKRITVMFQGVSTSGTSPLQMQIGAGSIVNTGYVGTAGGVGNTGNVMTVISFTAGFGVVHAFTAADQVCSGSIVLTLLNAATGLWSSFGVISLAPGSFTGISSSGGSKTLSGTLDRVRITTVNGTDTFDAGSINILYE
jgi:hypothetical protein